jgi:TPR repeat protein
MPISLRLILQKEEARRLWLLAAKYDYALAQNNLGHLAKEEGDLIEAEKWYIKAATKGCPLAINGLSDIGCKLFIEDQMKKQKNGFCFLLSMGIAALILY